MSSAGNGAPALHAAEVAPGQMPSEHARMDRLSSSKVTVEYHDPAGIFRLVQDQLISRFPLKNLHWKSPTRPLRSIDSLHVDLVPSADSVQPGVAPKAGTPTNAEHNRGPSKERRHQIPGLRQTPYLKVYLLRCDDSETYKSTARKQLREWVKAHTAPSQSSSSASTQENHDAFEWIIIHVVIPDTAAATQPRGSASAATGEKEKTSAVSRFTRGTTTILEKIRADFNSASKSAPDRVAQVRLPKEAVPPHMLPTGTTVTSPPITESPQEQERAWNDVIARFKTLILLSFDLRVSQYEEDIREKDSQRTLPGWNFCTFFMLKEGLAKGFESVGLVEDALLGYDELSVGLDTIIRYQAAEGNNTQGGVLLYHTEDLYQKALEVLKWFEEDEETRGQQPPGIHEDSPINAKKKDYRGMILSNNISIFDFRSYIFARQMSLLLRLGNSYSARSDLATKLQPRPNAGTLQRSLDDSGVGTKSTGASSDSEDLISLAELCSRALNFITFAGRLLRDDLVNGAKAHGMEFPERLVDNAVRSWTFAALEQTLGETCTSSLPFTKYVGNAETGSSGKMLPFGKGFNEQKIAVPEQKSMIHPTRSSSLNAGRSNSADPPYAQPGSSGQVVFENGQYQDRAPPAQGSAVPQPKSGQQELAAARAQLLVVQRRIFEYIGKSFGWRIGWTAILDTLSPTNLSDVDLGNEESDEESTEPSREETPTNSTLGLSAIAIINAVSGLDSFRQFYESLSDLIVKHYMAAGQHKSSESILGDLAALRFELGDYNAAAMYFGRMASLFAETRWNMVETTMLKMYAHCLKKLNRKDEYIRTLLDLLAKSAASRLSMRSSSKRVDAINTDNMPSDWLNDDNVDTTGVFGQLVDYSRHLPKDKNAPMAKYFNDIVVEPYVRHFDKKDGFQLRLQFRHILEDDIEMNHAKVRLVSATSGQGKDMWLESAGPLKVTKGLCRVWLNSNENTIGPYLVDKIILQAKRIAFVHEPFVKAEATTPLGIITSVSATSLKVAKKSRILCFPRVEAFQARLFLSHFIHIDKPRHIEIEIKTGWNEIQRAEIRLKSASAGLRLRTASATSVSADVHITDTPSPGVFTVGDIPTDTTTIFKIPYETETILPDLTVKLEIDYVTEDGQFQYHSSFTVPVELPLDVNVHDHFKNASLYSKFNIKTASQVPLEILGVSLEGSGEYEVEAPRSSQGSLLAFPKQPVAMTYRINKKRLEEVKRRQSQLLGTGKLALSVEYRCLDEDVFDRAQVLFADAVKHSPVHRLARLLMDTFADRLKRRVLPHQYEQIALLEKLELSSFEDMGWLDCLESLPHTVRDDAQAWLQKWHESHKTIFLPKDPTAETRRPGTAPPSPYPPRRMIITVSIPQTHIVHTAGLSLTTPEPCPSHGTTMAVVGQPLMAELRIKHTRRWGSPSSLVAAANLSLPSDAIEFVYTLEANAEAWLVAGQRRAHFAAKEDEEHKFSVMLVPLKAGTALLPSVEIRARVKPKAEDKRQSGTGSSGMGEDEEPLNCETDYLSYGECVTVVADMKSSTVGMGEMGSWKSAVWLEAVTR